MRRVILSVSVCLALSVTKGHAADPTLPKEVPVENTRKLRAKDVFDYKQQLFFKDDFQSGALERWNFSENDRYQLPAPSPDRINVVDAPGLPGKKAVRFVVPRAPNSFRSEISLPHEAGFQERWYAARILIPNEWETGVVRGNDIVMQWHAIPGNWRATFPNLELSVGKERWYIRQSFGSPQTKPTRTNLKLEEPIQRGVWVSWVIHAKWSPNEDGVLEIWRDGKLVLNQPGPNVYGTIGVEYTPYLKTGIYHPEWKARDEAERAAFAAQPATVTQRVVYVADIKVGNERATFDNVAPRTAKP